MENKNRQAPSRIPVRFVDDEGTRGGGDASGGGPGELTPEEIGEQSIYEGETDARRRMRRGDESEGDPDERDVAGATALRDTEEGRTDRDTRPRTSESAPDAQNEG